MVGLAVWELQLHGCASLKEKRSVIKSLKQRLHNEFNVSVAETGHQDAWQQAEIACAAVGSAQRVVDETLRAADRLVEEADGVRIMDTSMEYR